MCGLFGYELVLSPTEAEPKAQWNKLVQALASSMSQRGRDSWGFAGIMNKNIVGYWRGLGSIERVPVPVSFDRLLGHTRYATHGAVTTANAHPFDLGTVIAAHNGVISNHAELETKDATKYPVDSLALLRRIADNADTKDVEGYGAVMWLDLASGKLHFSRLLNGDLEAATVSSPDGSFRATVIASRLAAVKEYCKKFSLRYGEFPKLPEGRVYFVAPDGRLKKANREISITQTSWYDARTSGGSSSSRGYCRPSRPPSGMSLGPCVECGHYYTHNDGSYQSYAAYAGRKTCSMKGEIQDTQRKKYHEASAIAGKVLQTASELAQVKMLPKDAGAKQLTLTRQDGTRIRLTECAACGVHFVDAESHKVHCKSFRDRCKDCNRPFVHKGCQYDGQVVGRERMVS